MSNSPPLTPASIEPSTEAHWRFEPIPADTEWVESYRPGGLHPVQLGDCLRDTRYTIVRKLGHGASSTVWLAEDKILSNWVAIKILRSNTRNVSTELQLHQMLLDNHQSVKIKEHVATLRDSFKHVGPNGEHQCLVFEPMGPAASTLFDRRSHLEPENSRILYHQAKSLSKQLLVGLHCLHSCRIAHGDTNSESLLITLPSLNGTDAAKLAQQPTHDNISPPVARIDGKGDRWSPPYLCLNRPLTELVDFSASIQVKLSDLGGLLSEAFEFGHAPRKLTTPPALRAPEIILGYSDEFPIDYQVDTWSFGCLAFEFVTGNPLFTVSNVSWIPREQNDDDHLLQMYDLLGPLPPAMSGMWSRCNRYFNDQAELIRTDVGPEETSTSEIYRGPSLETMLDESKPEGMTRDEALLLLDLLKKTLRYNPALRPSTEELLAHEWLNG